MSKDRALEDLAEMVDGFVNLAKLARKAEREAIIVWLRGSGAFKAYGVEATWIATALEACEDKETTIDLEKP